MVLPYGFHVLLPEGLMCLTNVFKGSFKRSFQVNDEFVQVFVYGLSFVILRNLTDYSLICSRGVLVAGSPTKDVWFAYRIFIVFCSPILYIGKDLEH